MLGRNGLCACEFRITLGKAGYSVLDAHRGTAAYPMHFFKTDLIRCLK
jgi:hypothetical protein